MYLIEVDPVCLQAVVQRKLTPECFWNRRYADKYRLLITCPPSHPHPGAGKNRAVNLALQLIDAAPNRPPWVEPVRVQHVEQHTDPQPTPPTAKPTTTTAKKRGKKPEFNDGRKIWRKTDLRVISKHSKPVLGKHIPLKALAALFPGREIFDPEDVTSADVGNKLALTVERIFKFEELACAWADAHNYRNKLFWFRTITACDAEAGQLATRRQELRYDRHNKTRRNERAKTRSKAMLLETTTTAATAGPKTLAGLRAEQKARTRAQCDALYDVLAKNGEQHEIAPLIAAVRRHPAWRDVADDKRYRTTVDRLDMLRDPGRIEDDRKPGPRGTFLRLVRVKNST